MLFKNGRYANVASTLALVVALGGTSYAAVAIPKNSVGSPQIINSSVKSKDVKNGSLKGVDFKAGEIPAGAQGPAGPAGPAGAVGPQGPVGPSNGYVVDTGADILNWNLTPGTFTTVATLNLPAGSYVLTGKVLTNNNEAAGTVAETVCRLSLNGVVDSGTEYLPTGASADGADRGYIVVAGAKTIAAPAAAAIECRTNQDSGNYLNRVITAVKVGSIN